MTQNQWKNDWNCDFWKEKGLDCSAYVRAEGFAKVFSEIRPDIVGLQEISGNMTDYLFLHLQKSGINDYALLYGKDTPVIYRKDKFELLDSEFFVYPEEVPGVEGSFNNDRTKSYCIAVLKSKEDGKVIIFTTTHLWYMYDSPEAIDYRFTINGAYKSGSDAARYYQINLATAKMEEYIKKYNCPAVLVGDMNEGYKGAGVRAAVENGYTAAYHLAKEKDETVGYHRLSVNVIREEYADGVFEDALDHILIKGLKEGAVEKFARYSPDYYIYLSDHSPAYADINL